MDITILLSSVSASCESWNLTVVLGLPNCTNIMLSAVFCFVLLFLLLVVTVSCDLGLFPGEKAGFGFYAGASDGVGQLTGSLAIGISGM